MKVNTSEETLNRANVRKYFLFPRWISGVSKKFVSNKVFRETLSSVFGAYYSEILLFRTCVLCHPTETYLYNMQLAIILGLFEWQCQASRFNSLK